MSENDGERELVLGNKQLLGIFFVATLLCGVFFAMGYVVGGNSAKAGAATAAATDSTETPSTDGKREEPSAPPVTTAATTVTGDTGSSTPAAEPLMSDNPAAAGPQPTYAPPASAPPSPSTAVASKPVSAPAANDVGISVPEAGASYLQVAALEKDTAGRLVASIREKGLPAILANSSKPDLYEALVGPYRSSLTLADAKNKLKALGFDPIVHKQ